MKTSYKATITLLCLIVFFLGFYNGHLEANKIKEPEERIVYVFQSMPTQIQEASIERENTPIAERQKVTAKTWEKNSILLLLICAKTPLVFPILEWYYGQGFLSGMAINSLLISGPLWTFIICGGLELIVYTAAVIWTVELCYDFLYVKMLRDRDFKTNPDPLFHRYIKRIVALLITLVAAALIEDYLGLFTLR